MTAKLPTFSVIIPVYNVEKYLLGCLNSIKEQSYRDFEVIMIDDGSPDNSGKLCDEFAISDARFKVIHQKNQGLSGARNTGIALAKGQYLVFVDSDDKVKPKLLEKLFTNIEANNQPEVVVYGYTAFHKHEKKTFIPTLCSTEAIKTNVLEDVWKAYAWNKCFKRRFFKYEFPLSKKYEDLYIIPIILWEAKNISLVQDSLYLYNCLNENSITTAKSNTKIFERLQARLQVLDYVNNNKITKVYKKCLANVIHDARQLAIKALAGLQPENEFYEETIKLLTHYQEKGLITNLTDRFWLRIIFSQNRFLCRQYAKYRSYDEI